VTVAFCVETRNRIRVSVAAYAYEIANDPIMSDAEFDELAASIDTTIATTRAEEDLFFLTEFEPHTGSWIHKHPDLPGIKRLFETYYRVEDDWKDLI